MWWFNSFEIAKENVTARNIYRASIPEVRIHFYEPKTQNLYNSLGFQIGLSLRITFLLFDVNKTTCTNNKWHKTSLVPKYRTDGCIHLMESYQVLYVHSSGAWSPICLAVSAILRNLPESYRRHLRSAASVSEQTRLRGKICLPCPPEEESGSIGRQSCVLETCKGTMVVICHPWDMRAVEGSGLVLYPETRRMIISSASTITSADLTWHGLSAR